MVIWRGHILDWRICVRDLQAAWASLKGTLVRCSRIETTTITLLSDSNHNFGWEDQGQGSAPIRGSWEEVPRDEVPDEVPKVRYNVNTHTIGPDLQPSTDP